MWNRWSESVIERRAWFPGIALCMLVSASSGWSQGPQPFPEPAPLPTLSADQVVEHLTEKNKERACALQHYTAVRRYRLEYHGFPATAEASMVVDVDFDAPGPKRFHVVSSTGSKLIESRVFSRLLESEGQSSDTTNRAQTELGPENYRFSLAGIDGTNYVLNVEPRVESKFLYRGKIWVDGRDFAVTRIEAQPARNPSFWTTKAMIHHTYQKVDGVFYLPKENKTVSTVRLGGTATLTIEYESYHVTSSAAVPPESGAVKGTGNPIDGGVWPDGGLNVVLANLAAAKK